MSLEDLNNDRLLSSSPELLRDFGFEGCHVHASTDATDLMLASARELLSVHGVDPGDLAALFVYSGLPHRPPTETDGPLPLFRYGLGRIRHELELDEVPAYRLSQLGCCGLASTLELAERVLLASDRPCALVLTGDCFGPASTREILFNLMSDAGSAVLLDRSSTRNRRIASAEIVQSYYWDPTAHADEILASYFPLAERTIQKVLDAAGWSLQDLRWIVPHNVSRRSWEILCDMLGFDFERVWLSNIPRIGHTVTCDHVINLHDMQASRTALESGDRLLLFTFGFGAAWSASIFEH